MQSERDKVQSMEEAALQKERELDQCKVCSYPVCMYAELSPIIPVMSGLWATDY